MPGVTLNASDAAELAQLLQFLSGWLSHDPGYLGASLASFVGNPAYGTAQLHEDLDRFAFVLASYHLPSQRRRCARNPGQFTPAHDVVSCGS